MSLNLKDIYKPIGRLYEEIPSANYAGDYLAANGWYNATEEDAAVSAANAALAENIRRTNEVLLEYNKLYNDWGKNCTFHREISSVCDRKNLKNPILKTYSWWQFSPIRWTFNSAKGCKSCPAGVMATEDHVIMDKHIKALYNKIQELKSQVPSLEDDVKKAVELKKKSTEASQETKSKTLDIDKARVEAEKQKKIEESKQKQTEAEFRSKKIFLSIIASGFILAASGYALFRK